MILTGQMPLSEEEAQELKQARQAGSNQDWLMDEPAPDKAASEEETTGDIAVPHVAFDPVFGSASS